MVAPDEFFSLEKFFCKKNRCVLSSGRLHNISISLGLGCGKISRLVVNTDCISTCIIFYFISALQSNSSILTINTSYIGYDVFFTSSLPSKVTKEILLLELPALVLDYIFMRLAYVFLSSVIGTTSVTSSLTSKGTGLT